MKMEVGDIIYGLIMVMVLIYSIFIEYGLPILILTFVPVILLKARKSKLLADLTIGTLAIIVGVATIYSGFDLNFEQALIVFCPLVGYLLVRPFYKGK